MGPSCEIKFDSPEGIYFAGQTISIQVDLTITEPLEPQNIFILIKGLARCNWIKKYRAHKKTRSVAFAGEEVYLDTIIYDHSEKTDLRELPAGTHSFNAACVLPTSCPTSVESTIGHLRYFAKVIVESKSESENTISFKRAFTVIRQFDLNYESSLRLKVDHQRQHTMCCWPCRSGPLKWTVALPMGGFAPGQKIPIHVDMVNHSGTAFRCFKFVLRRIMLFHAAHPKPKTRREKEQVADGLIEDRTVDYGETHLEHLLEIPAVPPTDMVHSKIIQISYELKVTAVATGFHGAIEIKIPIVIGTVPLYPLPIGQLDNPGGAALPAVNPNYSSPVYEPEHLVPKQIKDNDDDQNTVCDLFAVKYPVFRHEDVYSERIQSMHPPSSPVAPTT